MLKKRITTLFLDIGGVLLTNGWGTLARNNVIRQFELDPESTHHRHHMVFDTLESGKMTLDEYLDYVVFYMPRNFAKEDFIQCMYQQSLPIDGSIDFFKAIKERYAIKVIAISNEARELNAYRFKQYKLTELFDSVISSAFVHFRKPDADIIKLAIDISMTEPDQAIYIDDRLLFVQVGEKFGLHGIQFRNLEEVRNRLETFGLSLD